jgi:cytochrome c oxidase assembly protein subunit 15
MTVSPEDAAPVLLSYAPAAPAAENMPKAIRAWLLSLALLVLLIVSVGGATRLTGSGLSITEWQPIVGTLPPLTAADWQEAFAKYRRTPQYERVNRGMDLQAFKVIFWWEWAHRQLARLIAAILVVPLAFFLFTRQIKAGLLLRLGGLLALGALQGAAGWYMVYSGLSGRVDVSQYRLALHLGLAMAIFGALLTLALAPATAPRPGRRGVGSAALIVALVFLQIVLGAFVAGMKAGLSHNTWPLMDGRLVPPGLGVMEPWYLNVFENAMTVQFNHRLVAYLLLLAALTHAWRMRTSAARVKLGALALAAVVLAQAGLGIWTLLEHVPLPLALAHQAAAAGLFAVALWHFLVLRQRD